MNPLSITIAILLFIPLALMVITSVFAHFDFADVRTKWKVLIVTVAVGLFATIASSMYLALQGGLSNTLFLFDMATTSPFQVATSLLVQLLGLVIGTFSYRYLDGEPRQAYFVKHFAMVLASVHLLLIANHWLIMIAAWSSVGFFMRQLLCFYPDRPFALLASHKKQIADRVADVLLLLAALLAWKAVGTGTISGLSAYVAQFGTSTLLDISALLLVFAVVIRTALLPVHGWLIQVMEAPTPVSALLHAGVINLSGFVVIRFSGLFEASSLARWLLILFGLGTAVLAGVVMLTRASIKVRLAWSTAAQMGFMLLECGLGLYTFAAIHLIGHSIYKAHAFLSASSIVQQNKMIQLHGKSVYGMLGLLLAPIFSLAVVFATQYALGNTVAWPWWWSAVLALAWAPVFWTRIKQSAGHLASRLLVGAGLVSVLTALLFLSHLLPLAINDAPLDIAGYITVIGMVFFYLCLVFINVLPEKMEVFRRWAYAGFYLDEIYTKVTLKYWPIAMK